MSKACIFCNSTRKKVKNTYGLYGCINGLKRNMQSIGIICGLLFIYVLAIRADGIDPTKFLRFNKLAPIFPNQTGAVKWPPSDTLTQIDMNKFAYALEHMKNSENVKYGGELPVERDAKPQK